jgi:hypothetical protein
MAQTVSLSTRVPVEVRDRLAAEAAGRGVPLATYTRMLLSGAPGHAKDASTSGEGSVVDEVDRVFGELPPDAGLRWEICLALARTVQAGGSAGISAGRELLSLIHHTQGLYAIYDDDDDEDGSG